MKKNIFLILLLVNFPVSANIDKKIPTEIVPIFTKERTPFTQQEQSQIEYSKAMNFLKNGRKSEAIGVLTHILQDLPSFHAARITLIELYKEDGQQYSSEQLALEGLYLDDSNIHYIQHLAAIYQEKGLHEKSLELLLSIPETERESATTKAMLALSYYQAGFYDLSEKYYSQLVRKENNNDTWLLGLAISQDSGGVYQEALKTYSRLRSKGTLEPKVLHFINQRIAALLEPTEE